MTMLDRLLPHPLTSLVIAVLWVLLANDFSPGSIVFGAILGLIIPPFFETYWPNRPRIRNPRMIVEYVLIVLWDIIVSNVQVAYLVLFRRGDSLRSRFITVPLRLKSAEAITVLAGTITMTATNAGFWRFSNDRNRIGHRARLHHHLDSSQSLPAPDWAGRHGPGACA
jgi:multicomponent K+:H+ antiporter subunit E